MNLANRPPLGLKADKPTAAEIRAGKEYMGRVKQLGCVVCGRPGPSDAHHCCCRPPADEPNAYKREPCAARRSSNFDAIPLCKSCHQDGPLAIHKDKRTWVERNGPDYGFIPVVRAQLTELELWF